MKLGQESLEMIAIFDYIRLKNWDSFIFHIANERKCSARHGAVLKRMGVLSGTSDIFIAKPSRIYAGAFIELKSLQKTGRYNKATPVQLNFIHTMNANGYYATVANGLDRCLEIINWYMN